MESLKAIIECLLFVADEPLTMERLQSVLPSAETRDIREALASLSDEYDARQGGFYLKEVAGGYQLRTRPEFREWIKELVKPSPVKLSRAALETLAIIAYRQPIIRTDIEHIRGVDSGGVLRMLLEKKLVRVLGRKDIPGRPMIYATTKRFLELFDLRDLRDLPTPKEIEALGTPDSGDKPVQAELPFKGEKRLADQPPSRTPVEAMAGGEAETAPEESDPGRDGPLPEPAAREGEFPPPTQPPFPPEGTPPSRAPLPSAGAEGATGTGPGPEAAETGAEDEAVPPGTGEREEKKGLT